MIEELLARGHRVVGGVRKTSEFDNLKLLDVELRVMELTDPESLSEATRGVESIVHLAAYYTFHGKKEMYQQVNVGGTRLLLEAAFRNSVRRFIYCSSTEAIGAVRNPPGDETSSPNPEYDYGKSKLKAEQIVREYGSKGMSWTIIRPSGIYGPRNVNDVSFWTITSFAKGDLLTKFVVGSGNNLIQFAHVKDVIQGFVLALENEDVAKNQVYIISEGRSYTYNELYKMLAGICGRAPPKVHVPAIIAKLMIAPVEALNRITLRENFMWHVSTVNSVSTDRFYSVEKAKHELHFSPRYDLKTGLTETVAWYRANGFL